MGEIHAAGIAEQPKDLVEDVLLERRGRLWGFLARGLLRVAGDAEQFRRDPRGRQDEIDAVSGDGTGRHAAVADGFVLSKGDTPPASLMFFRPRVPSEPVPDRLTPTAW